MQEEHAQLSARELNGPIHQLNVNLAGKQGRSVWFPALKRFLRRENPWSRAPVADGILLDGLFESSKLMALRPETEVRFVYERSRRTQADIDACEFGAYVIQPYLFFRNGDASLLLEFDQVLEWGDIPNPVESPKLWRQVKEIVAEGSMTPDYAFLLIAFSEMGIHSGFRVTSTEDDGNEVCFNFRMPEGKELQVEARVDQLQPFLEFLPAFFEEADDGYGVEWDEDGPLDEHALV